MASKKKQDAPFVRGDAVKLDLDDGQSIEFPRPWGMVQDPSGTILSRCEVLILPYEVDLTQEVLDAKQCARSAREYFGSKTKLYWGDLEVPRGRWERVGRVVHVIWYRRYGFASGNFYHPFKQSMQTPVDVHRLKSGKAYKLSLPDGCVLTRHGFVWP